MLRCEACGRENPEENRFCGQCGAALSRPAPPSRREEPRTVSGPSFLGLGEPEPYRYEDDEEEVERSSWRGWVALALLLVVGGLVWKQWQYSAALHSEPQDNRPSAVQSEPAAPSAAEPAPDAAKEEAARPAEGNTQDQAATGETEPETAKPDSDSAETTTEEARKENDAAPAEEQPSEPSAAEVSEEHLADKLEKERMAKGGGEQEPAKPAATESDADLAIARRALAAGDTEEGVRRLWASTSKGSSIAPVLLADMYLKGENVERSCEQALVLLNSAARRQNAQARARLGQMYAEGQCAQQDRVAAYHWYTLALNAAPEDDTIRRRREQLWNSMTEMEREEARALAR